MNQIANVVSALDRDSVSEADGRSLARAAGAWWDREGNRIRSDLECGCRSRNECSSTRREGWVFDAATCFHVRADD